MANQLTSNVEALRLFFTDDVYLVKDPHQEAFVAQAKPLGQELPEAFKNDSAIDENSVAERVAAKVQPSVQDSSAKRQWQFEYLGKNQKRILILVNDTQHKVSSPEGTELLRKLAKAIELTNNDFALINYANYLEAQFEDLQEFFNCELVLAFGVEATKLGLTAIPLHQLHQAGDTRFVFTSNLHDLTGDLAGKKALWGTLQQINNRAQ